MTNNNSHDTTDIVDTCKVGEKQIEATSPHKAEEDIDIEHDLTDEERELEKQIAVELKRLTGYKAEPMSTSLTIMETGGEEGEYLSIDWVDDARANEWGEICRVTNPTQLLKELKALPDGTPVADVLATCERADKS